MPSALTVGRASRLYLAHVHSRKLVMLAQRSVAACADKAAKPDEVKKLLNAGSHKYLDVRTPAEYNTGHVDGATNVPVMLNVDGTMAPNAEFLAQVEAKFPKKDTALVVGCKSGRRSAAAIEKMSVVGYTNLTNMTGGYDAWLASLKK
jgi:rhodanese-related sulfurtransferase